MGLMIESLLTVAIAFAFLFASASSDPVPPPAFNSPTILYLPIDERYATRGMFLNLASSTTPYRVLTPPESIICYWKRAGVPLANAARFMCPFASLHNIFIIR
jgi:hypothetical protein